VQYPPSDATTTAKSDDDIGTGDEEN